MLFCFTFILTFCTPTFIEGSQNVTLNDIHHFGNANWKWICTRIFDPGQDMAVISCDFQIPEQNFDRGNCGSYCGVQAIRVNYGYGEFALQACTNDPLWVSKSLRRVFALCFWSHSFLSSRSFPNVPSGRTIYRCR